MPTYADRAWQGVVLIDENVAIARDTYRVRVRCPEIARTVVPGQFVMLRLPGSNDPLLGRPLAVYNVVVDAAGKPIGLDIVYLVVGKMTRQLAHLTPGTLLEAWGPLGNGFPPIETEHLVIVAGGIGQTPFLMLAQEYLGQRQFGDPPREVRACEKKGTGTSPDARFSGDVDPGSEPVPIFSQAHTPATKVTFCYGARNKEYLAGVDDFRRSGVDVRVATDDGSAGHHGLVTELIRPAVESSPGKCRLVCCGPEAMMKAAAAIAAELGVDCQVSLETPMACGIGVCFSCVAKVRDASGGWDYRRTCVEGPVFDARDIVF